MIAVAVYKDGSEKKNLNYPLVAEVLGFSEELNFRNLDILEAVEMWGSTLYEGGLPQIGSIPDSIPEIAINEGRPRYTFYPSEIGTSEINIFPYNKLPFSIAENSVPHSRTTEVDINKTTFQINATEVNASEKTFTSVLNSSSSEISPFSSVEAQQFLSIYTHLYTFSLTTIY
ncbi:hypothetical protein [Nostoc commune]|uniref:hypothetical protein n=1 Tax=Nostoc commune TaxID=1178 RepID=UPI0015E80038|nr:hypothetical protein [Nostoc commune]